MIGTPELLVLSCLGLTLLLALVGRSGDDADHGGETRVGRHTLAHYARLEQRQGWDREAEHCGPWQGRLVTEAARTLRWRETE